MVVKNVNEFKKSAATVTAESFIVDLVDRLVSQLSKNPSSITSFARWRTILSWVSKETSNRFVIPDLKYSSLMATYISSRRTLINILSSR